MKKNYSLDKHSIRQEVLQNLQGDLNPTDEEVYREIDRIIVRNGRYTCDSILEKGYLREQIFNSIRGFDILEQYLRDESVSEIMVIGANKIFVEQNGMLIRTSERFAGEEEVYRLIDHIVSPTNRIVNESVPIVDCRLEDGSRVHIVMPPVSLEGPVITIRKFPKEGMTIERLVDYGEFPRQLAPVLKCLVNARYNILVSGSTNSGKSSLLNALAEYIPSAERIIVIEDSAELQFYHVDNLVRLETRNANMEGKNEISMNDLIKASLRMRPDRIIVGEVRGGEAVAMLQALSTGHSGSFSTIHANSCVDALSRLQTMVLMGMDIPLRAVQGQIGSAIDILIHLGRDKNGKRRIMEICELCGFDGSYEINPLFTLDVRGRRILRCGQALIHDSKLKERDQYRNYKKAMDEYKEYQEREEREGKDTVFSG